MSSSAVRTREWLVLWVVTGVALLLLLWAATKPAVCAAVSACTQGSRILPAVIGAIVVVGLAVVTALLALRHAGKVREGVRRSESVIAVGATAIGLVGVGFTVATLFGAGFALML